VVVVLGADLTKYLLWPETQRALEPELQAEIQFGIENSRDTGSSEVLENVRIFLAQSDAWRANAEPLLAEYRHGAERVPPPGTDALAAAVEHEVNACEFAAAGCWADATRAAQDAARILGSGDDATRGYRALWLYLAGVWADQAGDTAANPALRRTARTLVGQAEQAAKPGTWTRELAPLPDMDREQLSPADATAVMAIATRIEAGITKPKYDTTVATMHSGLAQTDPGKYEPALTTLGILLGANAAKPAGQGRCDSVWCWQNDLWLAIEAKSDEKPTGMIPHRDIRQANDQLRLLCADRQQDAPPVGSATVIMSPKPAVAPEGLISAEPHVYVAAPMVITDLARDTTEAWDEILVSRAGHSGAALRELIAVALARHSVLPSQVLDRLTLQPVSPTLF
jgi:hypothetical protein